MTAKYSKSKIKLMKFLAAVLCVGLIMPTTVLTEAKAADTIAGAQAQLDELAGKKEELNNTMSELKANEAQKVEYQETLEEKIATVIDEMTATKELIVELDKRIVENEAKIEEAESKISDTMNLFYARMKALYMSGSSQMSTLEVLLNADSLHDFTMKAQMMESINEHDSQILKKVEGYLQETEEDRTQLKSDQDELAEQRKAQDSQKAELDGLVDENKKVLSEIADSKQVTQRQMDQNDEDSAAIEAELNSMIEAENERQRQLEEERRAREAEQAQNGESGGEESNGGDDYSGQIPNSNGWRWPIPGISYVSQQFGNNGHGGADIAGGGGNRIVAAKAGKVLEVVDYWDSSMGYSSMASYGNYVLIWHDYTYSTRYAHLSSVSVSVGDIVEQGQTIGYEGNTGRSSGPHLHFEVIENGTRVNPMNYV